jgi:hypothetical protein
MRSQHVLTDPLNRLVGAGVLGSARYIVRRGRSGGLNRPRRGRCRVPAAFGRCPRPAGNYHPARTGAGVKTAHPRTASRSGLSQVDCHAIGSAPAATPHGLWPHLELCTPPKPVPQVQPKQDQRPGDPDDHGHPGPRPSQPPAQQRQPRTTQDAVDRGDHAGCGEQDLGPRRPHAGGGHRRRQPLIGRRGLKELLGLGHQPR